MRWIRFDHEGTTKFGTLADQTITVFQGDMFGTSTPAGETIDLGAATVLTPCEPSKMIGLWNNFHALAAKLEVTEPEEPLYFLKAPNAFLAHGQTIRRPKSYDGPVIYEGELGIVIAKTCAGISEADAAGYIFGYTCVNDVTAAKIIQKDPSFPQWARAKSYDTFGVFGPVIRTDMDPMTVSVRTVLNDAERQNYPVADMIFPPTRLVSLLSHDMTLEAGDLIACGTSIGVGSMKEPSNKIDVTIEGIGTLSNRFVQ